ncbi:DUF262 domain-containing protein [Pseudomonas luteola]|uniref:DUF262 domain-containing protein n=1 Tax=Pseudomonas luteola TaxID=47886 RepID=UPI001EF4EF6D|nr:DUF262 domain-containing protein [Pseudomonas luteola]MCG7374287.1 DUF262 domain-containing protein [Pseudomonas luteola]
MPDQVSLPEKLLIGTRREFMVESLIPNASRLEDLSQITDERRLLCFTLPAWQRPEVWNYAQKQRFIEGIFLGLGCGYLVANGRDWCSDGSPMPMSGWLIDGQQRVSSIRDFINGDLEIFNGIRFADLDEPTRTRRFWRVPFPHFELDYVDDERILQELYDRLNFGGTPHLPEHRLQLSPLLV